MNAITQLKAEIAAAQAAQQETRDVARFLKFRTLPVSATKLNAIQPLTQQQLVDALFTQRNRAVMREVEGAENVALAQIEMYAAEAFASYETFLAAAQVDDTPKRKPRKGSKPKAVRSIEQKNRDLWLAVRDRLNKNGEDFMNAAAYDYTAPTADELAAKAKADLAARFGTKFKVTIK